MKSHVFGLAAVLGLLAFGMASAASYKCKDAKGNWTEAACTGAAAPPEKPDPALAPATPTAAPAKSSAIQDISDSVEDSNCRRSAEALSYTPSDQNIVNMQSEKNNLEGSLNRANNNLAGATWQQGIRKQIGDIDMAISQERMRISQERMASDATARAALADCDRQKVEREKRRQQ